MLKRLVLMAGILLIASQPAMAEPQAADQQPVDPARLEAARSTVAHIFPSGTYARIMERSLDASLSMVTDSISMVPLRELAAISGKSVEELERLGDASLKDVLAIFDPAYDQRIKLIVDVMSDEMAGLMTQFEPSFQDGLAHAYARRFTVDQLAELNGFFVTPTGKAYAAESMIIMTDPEVMAKMQAMMPALMKEVPRLAGKLQQAASELPEPRKPEDLNDADKARLADLLGVPLEEIGRQGD